MNEINNNCIFSLNKDDLSNILFIRLEYLRRGLDDLLKRIFTEDCIPKTDIFIATLCGENIFIYRDGKVSSTFRNHSFGMANETIKTFENIEYELCKFLNIPKSDIFSLPIYGEAGDFNTYFTVAEIIIVTEDYNKFMCLHYFYERFCFAAKSLVNNIHHLKHDVLCTDDIINSGLFFFKSRAMNKEAKNDTPHLPDFNFINKLSALSYENQNCDANIVCIFNEIDTVLVFEEKIKLCDNNSRQIRKLLEIAKNDMCLVVKCIWDREVIIPEFEIIGVATHNTTKSNILFKIKGHLEWELYYTEKPALKYKYGQYLILYDKTFDSQEFKKAAKKILKTPAKSYNKLNRIILEALKQKHGTTIILTIDAKKEANRLCYAKRGMKIKELDLTTHLNIINNITSIDGAIIVDENGVCYGIGIILDGDALVKGTPARGARYNSAFNYIAVKKYLKTNYMAIVISEDKTCDLITTETEFEYI